MPKTKRILFGTVDIGYRIAEYSKFIKDNFDLELKSESFSKYVLPKAHYKTEYTYTCPIDTTPKIKFYFYCFFFFIRALFRYQIFHFFSGETILPRKLQAIELFTYKLLKKKVIMHFVGSDIRSNLYLEDKGKHLKEYLKGKKLDQPISEDFQLELIRISKKYANHILVSTPDLLEIIPEATYLPACLDVKSDISSDSRKSRASKVSILHSPSGTKTKGSSHITECLLKIKNRYPDSVELILPKGNDYNYAMTRYDIFEAMQSADIVVDQLLIGWYGLKSIEALYFGCDVFCFVEPKLKDYLFPNSPIILVDVNDLEENLSKKIDALLVENNRLARTKRNRTWINNNHKISNYTTLLTSIWTK